MNKIKTVKQYLKEGPPKFNIIHRIGASADITILGSDYVEKKRDYSKDISLQISPPDNGIGIIQDVVRISDDIIFSQGDNIDSEKGNCFLVLFNEDGIHCDVAYLFEQNLVTVDIDSIIKIEIVEVDDEDDSLGGEKYDLGD